MATNMMQPGVSTTMSRMVERCRRYVSVWRWLLGCNFRTEPWLLVATIIFGVGGRLGTLVGFALAVKCAAFILKPELIPAIIEPHVPEDPRHLVLLLAMIPGLAFVGGAVAQILHNSLILRLRNSMAESLSLQAAETRIAALSARDLGKGELVTKVASRMRTAHAKLVSIEVMLVNLIVLGSVVLLAFVTGILIDWLLMSVVTSIGLTFSLATAVSRHLQGRDKTKQHKEAQASEKSQIKAMADLVDADVEAGQNRQAVGQGLFNLAGTMSNVRSVDQRFNNISALILDLGQAVIIVTFLALLIGSDETAMPMLIILVLIFRFFVSYLQNITHTVIKLGTHYPFLVDLWQTLSDVAAAGMTPSEPEQIVGETVDADATLDDDATALAIDGEERPSNA